MMSLILPIEDCVVKIKPTAALTNFVKTKLEITADSPENIIKLNKCLKNNAQDCLLYITDIKWLNEKLIEYRKLSGDQIFLNELLIKTNVILPQLKVVPRNPILDARVKKLIIKEKDREYTKMTRNVDAFKKLYPEDTISFQMKEMNKQLIAVAQFVFSVITGFVFGFMGIELIVGNLDFGFRLLLGIMFALIVALAEIYFLAKKLNEYYSYEPFVNPQHGKMHQD